MYNLLVVDDEELAVKGIVHGIDWSDLPIGRIFEAYDAEEAKRLMREHPIHLLLSDIDMPDETGIELLSWVKGTQEGTETIFLTGHADFNYAQQALQLDCFDYLLKPIDHEQVKQTVRNAIDKIRINEEQRQFQKTLKHYYEQWNRQLPVLTERFWQDVLSLRQPMAAGSLENIYAMYNIPLSAADRVQLVLISVEQWKEPLSARDEEIMTYAVKNAGEELILQDLEGALLQFAGGALYAVIYRAQEADPAKLAANCATFIEQCEKYLQCRISCYIGEAVHVPELNAASARLLEIERDHLSPGGQVVLERDYRKKPAAITALPHFSDWEVLLEMGKDAELHARMDEIFARIEQGDADALYLEGFYHGLVYTVLNVLQKKTAAMADVFPDDHWRDGMAILRSIPKLKEWAYAFVDRALEYVRDRGKEVSPFVRKAIRYIEEHLDEDLGRDEIANYVFLNSAYLSRLFKRELGKSLSEYILEARINKVKPLLEETNIKISEIALSVGYSNFSHFTRMFKKATGLTPHEYRRQFQRID